MNAAGIEKVRLVFFKKIAALLIANQWVGRIISYIYADRIPSNGFVIDTSSNVLPRIKARIFWRIYESAEIKFVKQYLRPDLDVVELGSSIGVLSCNISKIIGNSRKLILVEANTSLVNNIQSNLRINGLLTANTTILPAAISYDYTEAGTTSFYVGRSNLNSSLESGSSKISVKSTTLSELLLSENIQHYSLVMDIEGGEVDILLNDIEALDKCEQLIVELHYVSRNGQIYTVEDLVSLFTEKAKFTLIARRGPVCVFLRTNR